MTSTLTAEQPSTEQLIDNCTNNNCTSKDDILPNDLVNPSILTAVTNNNNNNTNIINANIQTKPSKSNLITASNSKETNNLSKETNEKNNKDKDTLFTLKKWNLVAMWSWDVECEVCAICRTPLMDSCLKCQTDNKHDDCVVVWGDCNHSFHNCCMSQWIKSRNLCPLCQSEWHVQRVGR